MRPEHLFFEHVPLGSEWLTGLCLRKTTNWAAHHQSLCCTWAYERNGPCIGRVQCFSMQVVMNKCFLLNPEKIFVQIRAVVFAKNLL